jgi:hypothetical protein
MLQLPAKPFPGLNPTWREGYIYIDRERERERAGNII